MRRFFSRFTISALIATSTVEVQAQNQLEQARILFDAGVQAYTAGRYKEAVESFKEAYALSGKPQAVFSLAQAERRLYVVTQDAQYLRSAIEHFRKYLEVVTEGGRRGDAAEALEQLELLAARDDKPAAAVDNAPAPVMGKILVSTTTPGATISIDGKKGAESPLVEMVTLDKHLVRISAPGYITEEREVTALPDTLVPVEITLREEPAYLSLRTHAGAAITIDGRAYGAAPLAKRIELRQGTHTVVVSLAGYYPRRESVRLEPGKTNTSSIPLERTRQRIASYVLLGTGGASLLAAGIQGVVAVQEQTNGQAILQQTKNGNLTQSQLGEYNGSVIARERFRTLSLITLAGAGVLGLAGTITYVYDVERTTEDAPTHPHAVGFSFAVTPSSAGLGIAGRF